MHGFMDYLVYYADISMPEEALHSCGVSFWKENKFGFWEMSIFLIIPWQKICKEKNCQMKYQYNLCIICR